MLQKKLDVVSDFFRKDRIIIIIMIRLFTWVPFSCLILFSSWHFPLYHSLRFHDRRQIWIKSSTVSWSKILCKKIVFFLCLPSVRIPNTIDYLSSITTIVCHSFHSFSKMNDCQCYLETCSLFGGSLSSLPYSHSCEISTTAPITLNKQFLSCLDDCESNSIVIGLRMPSFFHWKDSDCHLFRSLLGIRRHSQHEDKSDSWETKCNKRFDTLSTLLFLVTRMRAQFGSWTQKYNDQE